jgi:DNA excision repair protein ERCC-2
MQNKKITAKEIVEYLYLGGDLTNEFKSNRRAKQGTEVHAFWQSNYKEEDRKEVSVKYMYDYKDYSFYITGRMDGLLQEDSKLIIEEIKSTETDLNLIDIDTRPSHLAQAKMYAYIYLMNNDLRSINVRLTYVTVKENKHKSFNKRYNKTQLEKFFIKTIKDYTEWLEMYDNHQKNKLTSLQGLTFPFDDYREGQYKFMAAVYKTLITSDILYSIAPTGIGKTIASLFSSLKVISNEKDKVFYLTAKNAGKKIVVDTVNLLKDKGLVCKTVVINSKESMCLMDKVDCDPDICPYAKGYFNRVGEALSDIFIHQDVYEMDLIKQYAEYHKICPHEFSLSISNFSDVVICDYNYAFDPRTHLIRYFDEEYYNPMLLIDEAHNMVDRSRSMYSATLTRSDLEKLKKSLKSLKPNAKPSITKLLHYIDDFVDENDIIKAQFFVMDDCDQTVIKHVERISSKLEQLLSENKKFSSRKELLDGYFVIIQFLKIYDFYNTSYRYIVETRGNDIVITLACLDASRYILDTIERRAKGAVFFSATLEPVDYYNQLITKGKGKSIKIPSPFEQNRLGLFVDAETSTRYRDRSRSVPKIIDTIYALAETRVGNYIVFFPSYQYLNMVLDEFDTEGYDVHVQKRNMKFKEREKVIEAFDSVGEVSKIGFFVLGGSFSEGIDYIGDRLSGVLVIGVALPQFNRFNELLKDYFDEEFDEGFDYAYTYPGMNKVIQAVGRVIRTETDYGVGILFDDRYKHRKYKDLFPRNWSHYQYVKPLSYLQDYLKRFWKLFHKSV